MDEDPAGNGGDGDPFPDAVEVPIGEELDLHAFDPKDVRPLVEDYLTEARARGFRRVRLIHGRGTGTQRAIVRSLLAGHPAVESFADAPPESGGWGATLVVLQP